MKEDYEHHDWSHPKVLANRNFIKLDLRNEVEYSSAIFIGSQFSMNHLLIDTMSEWTIVIGNSDKVSMSNYDADLSYTKKDVMTKARTNDDEEIPETKISNLGSVIFNGEVKKEYMCL